jgi:hypothetical protein
MSEPQEMVRVGDARFIEKNQLAQKHTVGGTTLVEWSRFMRQATAFSFA